MECFLPGLHHHLSQVAAAAAAAAVLVLGHQEQPLGQW